MQSAKLGLVLVSNTQERIEEISSEITEVLMQGRLCKKDGEKLRGRLQLANIQLFGRSMRRDLKNLNRRLSSGRKKFFPVTIKSLKNFSAALEANKARRVSQGLADFIRVYVDAAYEAENHSGVGGLCVNRAGEVVGFFSKKRCQKIFCSSSKKTTERRPSSN